jgi:hypothetical protein
MARTPASFSKPEGFKFPLWAIAAVVVGGIAIVSGLSTYDRFLNVRDAGKESGAAGGIVGAPCPTVTTADAKAQGLVIRYASPFNGVTYGRRFGELSCSEAAAKGGIGMKSYSVCQFSAPDLVTVQTAKGTYLFHPGVGRKASILMDGPAPRCVMAAPDWS